MDNNERRNLVEIGGASLESIGGDLNSGVRVVDDLPALLNSVSLRDSVVSNVPGAVVLMKKNDFERFTSDLINELGHQKSAAYFQQLKVIVEDKDRVLLMAPNSTYMYGAAERNYQVVQVSFGEELPVLRFPNRSVECMVGLKEKVRWTPGIDTSKDPAFRSISAMEMGELFVRGTEGQPSKASTQTNAEIAAFFESIGINISRK